MRKRATAVLALVIGASLVGCVTSEGNDEAESVAIEDVESASEWTDIDLTPKPDSAAKPDTVKAADAMFWMLVKTPEPLDPEDMSHNYATQERRVVDWNFVSEASAEATGAPHGLVMRPDGIAYLAFRFESDNPRTITNSYMTDSEHSSKRRANLDCEVDGGGGKHFICHARFKHTGGTFYAVIETDPVSSNDGAYGVKRAVASITVQAYGGESDTCGMVRAWPSPEEAMQCLSLPKK